MADEEKQAGPLLGFDWINKILLRMTCSTLCRFALVCKRWRDLFRESWFIKNHKKFATRNFLFTALSRLEDGRTVTTQEFYNYDSNGEGGLIHEETDTLLEMLQCDGLFCLWLEDHIQRIILWNPSIRERRDISPTFQVSAFDAIGFGFRDSTNDYKIILVKAIDRTFQVQILDLTSGRHQTIDFNSSHRRENLTAGGCLVGHNVFWLWYDDDESISRKVLLLRFNIEFDSMRISYGPDVPMERRLNQLFVIRKRLCIFEINRDGVDYPDVVVWTVCESENENFDPTWSKWLWMDMIDFGLSRDTWSIDELILGRVTKDSELLVRFYNREQREVYSLFTYNIEGKSITRLQDYMSFGQHFFRGPYEYTPSNARPPGMKCNYPFDLYLHSFSLVTPRFRNV